MSISDSSWWLSVRFAYSLFPSAGFLWELRFLAPNRGGYVLLSNALHQATGFYSALRFICRRIKSEHTQLPSNRVHFVHTSEAGNTTLSEPSSNAIVFQRNNSSPYEQPADTLSLALLVRPTHC